MEKNWYYSSDGQEKKGPVTESELKQMLAIGQLPAATLVWSEGMASWTQASSVAALQQQAESAAVPVAAATPAAGGSVLPQGLGGWMTFVGVMHIVGGVFACLSCFGLIYGIPMIIGGVGLMGAKNLLVTLPSVDPALFPALDKLRSAFKAIGWSYILMVIATVVFMIVYFVFIFAMIARVGQSMPH